MRHICPWERLAGLDDAQSGLSAAMVEERRRTYGSNDILLDRRSGWSVIVRDTARDPMVWFLVLTAGLFAWIGDYTEAAVLGLAILPIAGMDAYLHRRTQASTEGLAGRLAASAQAVRDGKLVDVPAADLVPGDLVVVTEGSAFPADGLIVAGSNMQADESTLTGEAMPVRKHPFHGPKGGDDAFVDSEFWGSAGTRLLIGEARQQVVFTGKETLYGEIVRSAREGQHEHTPLQRAITSLVSGLVTIALLTCVALAATRYFQGFGLLDAFISAVTLAVAAMPEEFPVAFTFFLGVGVYRLARRQALVRRAVVVENIGRVTTICSDKTGTITAGKLTLGHILPADGISPDALKHTAAMASRSTSNDPIDIALLEITSAGPDEALSTFPFTEDRRRETRVFRDPEGFVAAVKGAPETVLAMTDLSTSVKNAWLERTEELGASGHKVLGVAAVKFAAWDDGEPEEGYAFLGLLAFEDPVRPGVKEAVEKAQNADIKVIMVTGDHATTAAAIAREINLGHGTPRVIEGTQLSQAATLEGFDVVARAVPSQKLDLVRALRASKEVVAVTGDGVNDVPALQGADIGIAMGERGTRAAREVASIVLLDDNFRTIVRAISEGRQLFENLRLSFAYLLMVHMPLVVTAALIPFAGFPLLYLPVHVVWLELIIHPTALLVFQQMPESDVLKRVSPGERLSFFTWGQWTLIGIVGVLTTALILAGFARSLGVDNDVDHARSMALVALVVASATMMAGLTRLRYRAAIIAFVLTIGSAIFLVQIPLCAKLLQLSPLDFDDWLLASLGGAAVGSIATLVPRFRGEKKRT